MIKNVFSSDFKNEKTYKNEWNPVKTIQLSKIEWKFKLILIILKSLSKIFVRKKKGREKEIAQMGVDIQAQNPIWIGSKRGSWKGPQGHNRNETRSGTHSVDRTCILYK